jgi:hypothetical protein
LFSKKISLETIDIKWFSGKQGKKMGGYQELRHADRYIIYRIHGMVFGFFGYLPLIEKRIEKLLQYIHFGAGRRKPGFRGVCQPGIQHQRSSKNIRYLVFVDRFRILHEELHEERLLYQIKAIFQSSFTGIPVEEAIATLSFTGNPVGEGISRSFLS